MLGIGFHLRGEISKEFSPGCWTVIGFPGGSNRKITYAGLYRVVTSDLWHCLAPHCRITGRMIKMYTPPSGSTSLISLYSLTNYHPNEIALVDLTASLALTKSVGSTLIQPKIDSSGQATLSFGATGLGIVPDTVAMERKRMALELAASKVTEAQVSLCTHSATFNFSLVDQDAWRWLRLNPHNRFVILHVR